MLIAIDISVSCCVNTAFSFKDAQNVCVTFWATPITAFSIWELNAYVAANCPKQLSTCFWIQIKKKKKVHYQVVAFWITYNCLTVNGTLKEINVFWLSNVPFSYQPQGKHNKTLNTTTRTYLSKVRITPQHFLECPGTWFILCSSIWKKSTDTALLRNSDDFTVTLFCAGRGDEKCTAARVWWVHVGVKHTHSSDVPFPA